VVVLLLRVHCIKSAHLQHNISLSLGHSRTRTNTRTSLSPPLLGGDVGIERLLVHALRDLVHPEEETHREEEAEIPSSSTRRAER
jgi:hypothetical protein